MINDSELALSYARGATYACNGRYFLRSCHMLTKSCRIHTDQSGSGWLITSIDPVIILDTIDILEYLPAMFIRFTLGFFCCLQCSLLLHLIVLILVAHLIEPN